MAFLITACRAVPFWASIPRAILVVAAISLAATPSMATVIGVYDVNYRFNAAGCPDGFPNDVNGGNPYQCGSIPPGPIFLNLAPGQYELQVLELGAFGMSNIYVWIGDNTAGFHLIMPETPIGGVFAFQNTSNSIALYYWDWFSADNTSDLSARLQLSTAGVPEPSTAAALLIGTAFVFICSAIRKRRYRSTPG